MKKNIILLILISFLLVFSAQTSLSFSGDGGESGGCGNGGNESGGSSGGSSGGNASGGGTGGDGGSSCFLPGTPIQMQDGTIQKIEDVQVGDKVVGFDIEKNEFTENVVLELENPIRNEWYKIILENGTILRTTNDHPIYVEEYDEWASIDPEATWINSGEKMKTKQLKIGQHAMDLDQKFYEITNIVQVSEEVQTYNFKRVSNNNTFFAEGFLVHNKSTGSGSGSCAITSPIVVTPVCNESCGEWSLCSASCGEGVKVKMCMKSDCTIYNVTTSCNAGDCCTDSSWTPARSTVCSGESFTQTSNCGSTRTKTGTKSCCSNTSWTPARSTVCSGTTFTQTSNCGNTRVTTGTKSCCSNTSWTPARSTVCSGTTFTQTSNCGVTRSATGTKCCDTSWTPATSTVCSGTTFTQTSNCGTTRTATGTKCCDTSWTPAAEDYCLGTVFTQTGTSCGTTQTATGTKTCSESYCDTSAESYSYCSNNDVYGAYDYWSNSGCSGMSCLGDWIYNSCGIYKKEECGSDTCNTSGTEYEYCQDGDVWVRYSGTDKGCASGSCYSNNISCGHQRKESCETGYFCEVTGTNQAECIAKSAGWVEG